ncbi:MAG: acetolactate synthase small subunit [Omnitrophica WOR_2 bacterium GWA2_47_8]|nr:MAG: acetolactate synthase small subunit [Omnitrophica WOR_2 bacterium GWA2_47_8]
MTTKPKNLHTISFLVANKPGVLVRIAMVFARRGYNIDSLVVSASVNPQYSRMTITASGETITLEQIIKQSAKLIDVLHVEEHTGIDAVDREYALVKIKTTPSTKATILKLCKKFHTHIVDHTDHVLIVSQGGTTEELDQFEGLVKKYGILEMIRSGKLVMAKGKKIT